MATADPANGHRRLAAGKGIDNAIQSAADLAGAAAALVSSARMATRPVLASAPGWLAAVDKGHSPPG
jgi:hypothetical protein